MNYLTSKLFLEYGVKLNLSNIQNQVIFTIILVGNIQELGNWDPYKGLSMQTNDEIYPYWFCDKITVQ